MLEIKERNSARENLGFCYNNIYFTFPCKNLFHNLTYPFIMDLDSDGKHFQIQIQVLEEALNSK